MILGSTKYPKTIADLDKQYNNAITKATSSLAVTPDIVNKHAKTFNLKTSSGYS
jgi:hypothetical protein